MNKLLTAQKNQVQEFRSIKNNFQQDVQLQKARVLDLATSQESFQEDVGKQFQQLSENMDFKSLTEKAFNNRNNIIIIGLREHETNNAYATAIKFFKTKLNIRKKLFILSAYRLGKPPLEGNPHSRPLMVKFNHSADRNLIWRFRNDVPQEEGQVQIKIQADLPKQLRDEVNVLYRVLRAASSMEEYRTALIRDFTINLHDKQYNPRQLESLPLPLRPSSLACKKSDQALTFFSKYSILSNHHHSNFTLDDTTYHSVEQYLAFKRAQVLDHKPYMERALQAKNPVEAKAILNALRSHTNQEWEERRSTIALEGLRAKFSQNEHLADYLKSTKTLLLGEASRNQVWGIGMTLEDKHVLDINKWHPTGNLLGTLLMQLRSELIHQDNPHDT